MKMDNEEFLQGFVEQSVPLFKDSKLPEIEPFILVAQAIVERMAAVDQKRMIELLRRSIPKDVLAFEVHAGASEQGKKDLEDFVAALLLSMFSAAGRQETPDLMETIAGRLLSFGQKQVTPPDKVSNGAAVAQARARAKIDLDFWADHRWDVFKKDLQEALVEILSDRKKWIGSHQSVDDALAAAVEEILNSRRESQSKLLADAWAIRTVSQGSIVEARASGLETLIIFNNPPGGPDSRTTPFCRQIHRKLLIVATLVEQVDDYFGAIEKGDIDKAKGFWPMVSSKTADGNSRDFEEAVNTLDIGPPPYHPYCRDVLLRP